jgi:hypothetical protein
MAMGNEIDNVKKATAILITCVVDAMGDLDVGFKDRFVKNLDRSYAKIRNDTDDVNALELLSWTRTMVTGFDFVGGQQGPFLGS